MSTTARHIAPTTIRATHRAHNAARRRHAIRRFQLVWARRINRHESIIIGLSSTAFVLGCAFAPAAVSIIVGSI